MYTKPLNLPERLSSINMSPARRRAAIANLERSETIMDLIVKARDVLRQARAGAARIFSKRGAVRYSDRTDYCGRLCNA